MELTLDKEACNRLKRSLEEIEEAIKTIKSMEEKLICITKPTLSFTEFGLYHVAVSRLINKCSTLRARLEIEFSEAKRKKK
jgi:endonuclease V-like protein UPF0215 family